jgi:murein L,D-transpeptidase YafK
MGSINALKRVFLAVGALATCGVAGAGSAPQQLAAKKTSASGMHGGHAPDVRHEAMMLLTVDKKSLSADLRTWPDDPQQATQLKSFRIAIGKGEGDKQYEGDNKTPEGIYFAQSHIDGAALPEKYGARAIPIDFPNPMDLISRKTGHGIWLHGVDRDARIEEAKVTEGCVAFYNSDIDRLSAWLKSHQGVVVIAHDATEVNRADDIERVREATMSWMSAWASRDVERYMSHYSPDFRYQHFDRDSYRDYKRRVFASYKVMDVKYDNLRVITHPKYAVSFFNQDFQGDKRFSSIGRKILYWERDAVGRWAIKREVFENRRFEHVTYTDGELALLSETGSGMPLEDKEKKGNL